jgi:hypothetical protein
MWFPDYTGNGTNTANLFISNNALGDAASVPTNTLAAPFGTTPSGVSSASDPNDIFVTSDTVKDFRTIGACLSLGYTGKLADCQGEVVCVRVPYGDLLQQQGNNFVPAFTIDTLFQFAGEAKRFTPAGIEMIWTPDEESHEFINELSCFAPVILGTPASVESTVYNTIWPRNPKALVIAWRGFDGLMPVTIKTTKSFEWRPKIISGLTHVKPNTLAPPTITAKVAHIVEKSNLLERVGDALTGGLMTAANHLADTVYNGVLGNINRGPFKQLTSV